MNLLLSVGPIYSHNPQVLYVFVRNHEHGLPLPLENKLGGILSVSDQEYFTELVAQGVERLEISRLRRLHDVTAGPDTKSILITDCPELTVLRLVEGVKGITIVNCKALNHLLLPSGVEHITLKNCKRIRSINVPDSLQKIRVTKCGDITFEFGKSF